MTVIWLLCPELVVLSSFVLFFTTFRTLIFVFKFRIRVTGSNSDARGHSAPLGDLFACCHLSTAQWMCPLHWTIRWPWHAALDWTVTWPWQSALTRHLTVTHCSELSSAWSCYLSVTRCTELLPERDTLIWTVTMSCQVGGWGLGAVWPLI